MIRLEAMRLKAGLSKSKLARMSDLNPAPITWAEQRGFRLYPAQLQRLADALCWPGNPEELLESVGDDTSQRNVTGRAKGEGMENRIAVSDVISANEECWEEAREQPGRNCEGCLAMAMGSSHLCACGIPIDWIHELEFVVSAVESWMDHDGSLEDIVAARMSLQRYEKQLTLTVPDEK